ncbi:pali-domain-containing protein [Guyanagaster necrorhizus]|uniref:Pali-domain-containing protein n=1 Tax=Guyanagaster necrorhizus TaxID=856835 RepID=A0A9P7W643_9AGAR|nr:pali-domain-containing protein [Guyanagaster necrorhizus MCA 3950]KAG7452924.1 pali-domain-containing protein [Guyanagaster necrorhizus MCA 3950]
MPASAAIPGLFCCFSATVLLVFVSVSVPTWNSIYFLQVGVGSSVTRFGVFGYTGSSTGIGYNFTTAGFNSSSLDTNIIYNLTKTLILHPIAAGLAGLAFLFGLYGAGYHRAGTVLMSLLAALATLVTLVAWVIDMVLFGIARSHFHDQAIYAQYGNACWLTLGALVALLLGFCASACGVFGSYRKRKEAY